MTKSNDEIYDLLREIGEKVSVLDWRMSAVEKVQEQRGLRTWQVWLAVMGPLIALVMSGVSIVKG